VVRAARAKRVDPAQAEGHAELGRRLLLAGRAIEAQGDARHASALAILAVHATIAYTDALCIKLGGRKSTSADHTAAARLLKGVLGNRIPAAMERILSRTLAEKDRFEYEGYVAKAAEAHALFTRVERYGAWAENLLASG
jgi:hypothetical protein